MVYSLSRIETNEKKNYVKILTKMIYLFKYDSPKNDLILLLEVCISFWKYND